MIDQYSDLKKTKLTWVDRNGQRCFADLCYRSKPLAKNISEVICVVTERHDNPGMSISNSADEVVDAIIGRFPLRDEVQITERYDRRSYTVWNGDEKPRYAQYAKPIAHEPVKIRPVPSAICEWFNNHWNDLELP